MNSWVPSKLSIPITSIQITSLLNDLLPITSTKSGLPETERKISLVCKSQKNRDYVRLSKAVIIIQNFRKPRYDCELTTIPLPK